MLKIVVVIFSVFSIYSSGFSIAHDQSESIMTSPPKKSIRALYDETITYFLSNHELATTLVSLSENIAQSNEGNEKILSLNSATKSMTPLLNDHQTRMIKLASDLNLVSVIKEMYLIKEKKLSSRIVSDTTSPKAELNQVMINFAH